jgi:hypothetical protein
MKNRSRLPIIAILIVSLLAAGFTRHLASAQRHSANPLAAPGGAVAGLSRMNSYALALLLGGLRGPLVMFLWPSSEEQKNQRRLEDFDTKIEWIRLLQAEFDTVHIFQMWNKAYNISAQMTNIGNKYRTILDAVDYGRKVDAERPHDINIIYQIGSTFFDKLGNSTEKNYYRERVREETLARPAMMRVSLPSARKDELINAALDAGFPGAWLRFSPEEKDGTVSVTIPEPVAKQVQEKLSGPEFKYVPRAQVARDRNDPAWRRTELDPIVDAKGNILPEYLVPNSPRPSTLAPDSEWNDGSELQYLKQFEPFPYGVSTLALGYNYFKRAQVLQSVNHQKHAQNSDLVIDSRPAQGLRNWASEEWERGRRAELEAFGKEIPAERPQMEGLTALVPLDAPIPHKARIDEALFSYDRCALLVDAAVAEYERHLANDKTNLNLYVNQMEDMRGEQAMVQGDAAYLRAMLNPAQRATLTKTAADAYNLAIRRYELFLMQYYIPDAVAQQAFPAGITRPSLSRDAKNLSDQQINQMFAAVLRNLPPALEGVEYDDVIREYVSYIDRAQKRLSNLNA